MSKAEKNFVPINKAQSEHVITHLVLPPFVNPDEIGINLDAVNKLCSIGGINLLYMHNYSGNEISSFTPNVEGFDGKGNAIASKSGLRTTASTFYTDSDTFSTWNNGPDLHTYRYGNLNLKVNVDEILQNLQQKKKKVSSSHEWAKQINLMLKNGLTHDANKRLMGNSKLRDHGVNAGLISFAILDKLAYNLNDIETVAFGFGLSFLASAGQYCLMKYLYGAESRFSLFCVGPELDREILFQSIIKTRRLAKAIDAT